MNLGDKLPILSKIALDYIWLPVSSCSVERSFSIYNNILNENRQNLSEDYLKRLNMMYFNCKYNFFFLIKFGLNIAEISRISNKLSRICAEINILKPQKQSRF